MDADEIQVALEAFLNKLYGDEPLAAGDCWGEAELTAAFTAAAPILVAAGRRQAAADALRDMADRIDRGPAIPLPPSVYSALIRERAADIAEGRSGG